MASLIDLIFTTSGAPQSAAAVKEVDTQLKQLNQSLGVAKLFGGEAEISAARLAKQHYVAAQAASSAASASKELGSAIQSSSISIRDLLMPNLEGATAQLLGMAAAAFSVREVYKGFRDAIGDGADLEHLSQRTNETVRNLVIEEQAFKNSGLGAQFLGTAINLMDRALSETAPNAKRNQLIFRDLGVSMTELRTEDFAGKINTLRDAFARLPSQAERAQLAMQLFGRYSGGQMLQLFSDPNAIALATEQAGRLGDRLQQDAAAFTAVQQNLGFVTTRLKEMWVAAAEGVLPALESIASVAKSIDLSGLGTLLGAVGPIAVGGVGALVSINLLDSALFGLLGRMQEGAARAIVRGASNAMADVAAWTPIGLAGAVALQFIAGAAQARASSEWNQVMGDIAEARRLKDSTNKDIGSVTTYSDSTKTAAAIQARLDDLQKQRGALDKELALAGPGVHSIDQMSRSDSLLLTVFAALSKHIGGADYVGTDGKKRDFPTDVSNRLKLSEEIDAQRFALQKVATPEAAAKTIAGNELTDLKTTLAPLVTKLPEMTAKIAALQLKEGTPLDQVVALQNRRRTLEGEMAQTPEGLSGDEADARRKKIKLEILQIEGEERAASQKLGDELKKNSDEVERRRIFELQTRQEMAQAAGDDREAARLKKEIETTRAIYELHGVDLEQMKQRLEAENQITQQQIAQKEAAKAIEAERIALENTLNTIRGNLAKIEADYGRTDAEKWQEKKAALQQEVDALQKQIDADNEAADDAYNSGDKTAGATFEKAAASKGNQLASTQNSMAGLGPDPSSVKAQLTAQMTELDRGMGTVAQQIGKSWSNLGDSMRSSLGGAFYDMMAHAKTFSQAAGAVWLSIRQSAAQSLSNMAADFVIKHVVMDNARRLFHALGLIEEKTATTGQVLIHGTGEAAKTGATAAGASTRTGIRLVETIAHGVMVAIRTAIHIAGELMQTTATIAQSGIRIAATLAESLVSIVKAAAGAMSAMASIPYVGPILAIAAAAAMIAEGSSLLKGARESGGPVEAGSAYLVGEKRPEIFVPQSDGYIFPDAAAFSAPSPRSPAPATFTGAPANTNSGRAHGGGGGGGAQKQNHYWFFDRTEMRRAMASDMYAVAHDVYDTRSRQS